LPLTIRREVESLPIQKEEKVGKELYDYQKEDLNKIFDKFHNCPSNYNLVYQLPTGGGKTVIFSEIARRYIEQFNKKVLILTHRIELSRQTHSMLAEFKVGNKVIDSSVKELPDQDDYNCFVAMVETLNNRLYDKKFELNEIGLVIIDEAHNNSFRKLFKYFENCFILGVTATPLSSNFKLPLKDSYKELIVGHSIPFLVNKGFLAKATTFSYDVSLNKLKIGINGDYTVRSSEELYSGVQMQNKLLYAYEQRSKGKKTLIFNNGINTSQYVYHTFKEAGYDIRHLDNTTPKKQRKEILEWFKNKPGAIISSVSILTTGFDEPTIESIILNRATRSLTLYYQMIGRGSRAIPGKSTFDVIDLGNNAARFGLWAEEVDWQLIFAYPEHFLENLISDDEIERRFVYRMPEELKAKFSKSVNIDFNIKEAYKEAVLHKRKPTTVIDLSIEQHAQMIIENTSDLMDGLGLARELDEAIGDRVRRYSYCLHNTTRNFRDWLQEEYMRRLRSTLRNAY